MNKLVLLNYKINTFILDGSKELSIEALMNGGNID